MDELDLRDLAFRESEQVEWKEQDGRVVPVATGTTELIEAELVLLAMGFVHPQHSGMVEQASLALDGRGNIASTQSATSADKVFVAGDAAQGASLVVRAIASGRDAARAIDEFLKR